MLPFASPLEPMLAQAQDEIPAGEGWLYESKWDGFRAIVFREGDRVHLCRRRRRCARSSRRSRKARPRSPEKNERAPNRWSKGQGQAAPVSLQPTLVCEVRYDYLQGMRFRHASTFQRWRDDREPKSCLFSQLLPPNPFSLAKIVASSPGRVAAT